MPTTTYTPGQATDEALLLLMRKLARLHPDAYADVLGKLPAGARDALNLAEVRADTLRAVDQASGTARTYPDTDD